MDGGWINLTVTSLPIDTVSVITDSTTAPAEKVTESSAQHCTIAAIVYIIRDHSSQREEKTFIPNRFYSKQLRNKHVFHHSHYIIIIISGFQGAYETGEREN